MFALAQATDAQSLMQIYQYALDYDATFDAAESQYRATLANAAQASAGLLPLVSAAISTSRLNYVTVAPEAAFSGTRNINSSTLGLIARQPIYRPANWATYQQGERQVQFADARLRLAKQDLMERAAQTYVDVLTSKNDLDLSRIQKTAIEKQLAAVNRNFELGFSTITDARDAKARYALSIAQEIASEKEYQIKRLTLEELTGHKGVIPKPLNRLLPSKIVSDDVEAWITQAYADSPIIEEARLKIEVAELDIEKMKAGHKPTVDLKITYDVANNPEGTTIAAGRNRTNSAAIGIEVNVPLFSGFSVENKILEANALKAQAVSLYEAERRDVAHATHVAYLTLLNAQSQVEALEAAAIAAQSALETNQRAYEAGMRISIDVLNAQAQLFHANRDLSLARYSVLIDEIKLRKVSGALSADDLLHISEFLNGEG